MRRPANKTTKLPKHLLDQLGGQDDSFGSRGSRHGKSRNGHVQRKEKRKAERDQKKAERRQPKPMQTLKTAVAEPSSEENEDEEEFSPSMGDTRKKSRNREGNPPKSILKRARQGEGSQPGYPSARLPSPLLRISKGTKDRLAQDDAEIAALEKRLGLKGRKKLPRSFEDDGLDILLDSLDGDDNSDGSPRGKRKRTEEEEWLERKRRKARGTVDDERSVSEDNVTDDVLEEDLEGSDLRPDLSEQDNELEFKNGIFDRFDGDASDSSPSPPRARENPYIAPPTSTGASALPKYIPPSLRGTSSSETEQLLRLRRQTQGLLNRLSEANLLSILGELEKLYRDNPRQHVTSTLIDLLLGLLCDKTILMDTFLILHAGFMAAVYKVIGIDFGAQVIQRLVEEFDKVYGNGTAREADGKETTNLIALLAELYKFQVVGSTLIFDYIRIFLFQMSEINTELLLKVIRNSGSQLRQDDPSALKEIVLMLQPAIAEVGEANLSVRTKYMIETINSLKNNRMKTGAAASAVTSEHTVRMKKIIGSLNTRSIRASEPLRVGLQDIRETEKKGKWWLVGASWKDDDRGYEESTVSSLPRSELRSGNETENLDSGTANLLQLAREQRMNTDIRRSIFITIMSASDYRDAHLRLMKLRLKRTQEKEVPRVLIQCAGAEQSYNPYYTLIARRLCSEHKLKMAFQFSLWDLFKRMGENANEKDEEWMGDEEDEDMGTRKIVNLAKMFGTLIAEGGLGLSVLKSLNLAYLQSKTRTFVELMLLTVISHSQRHSPNNRDEKPLINVLAKAKDTPQVARDLEYFLQKVVSKSDVVDGRAEKETVKWACRVASNILKTTNLTNIFEE
ncbi:MAG: suppressor of glycerol defect [Pycnora praestabilis]|nr:MAG: suppressor of glycerol defect [Pycnora praestabilis]